MAYNHELPKLLEQVYNSAVTGTSTDALTELREQHNLTDAQSYMLAQVFHFYPTEISEDKMDEICYLYDGCFSYDLQKLIDEQIISWRNMTGGGKCYRLEDAAYQAIRNGKHFRFSLCADCIAALAARQMPIVYDPTGYDIFIESLHLDSNKAFVDGLRELGYEEMANNEKDAVITLAWNFAHNFTKPFDIDSGSGFPIDFDFKALASGVSSLANMGIAVTPPEVMNFKTGENTSFVLSPQAVKLLFAGHDELIKMDQFSSYGTYLKHSEIEPKTMFYSSQNKNSIDCLRRLLSEDGYSKAVTILTRQKRKESIQCLFWGPPGTGKTESVKQIARETGRDIFVFDISKMLASEWGASEKIYKSVFNLYKYVTAVSSRIPILLLNEADPIICRRIISIRYSIDKSENNLSNILLQEFEDMTGIVLATTNLIDNLDPAFDRRFLFKIEVTKPDAVARAAIWKASLPDLTDDNAKAIASEYEMSGAQIDNVAAKYNLAELWFEGSRDIAFLRQLIDEEIATEKRGIRNRVGF